MVLEENKILENLKSVIDPEIGINIVDLGLVYGLDINENEITVTMTLTTPGCPMHNSITNWVQESLSRIDKNIVAHVNLVWEPRWSPDKMSDTAKGILGI